MATEKRIHVLFVCMGNICRSPMAEAVFRHQVAAAGLGDRFVIDSAGTGGWHVGERPHRGTLEILATHGIDAAGQQSRQLRRSDFDEFDYILAMDEENLDDMAGFVHNARRHARLLLDFAPSAPTREVPDPYYTGGFAYVYNLVDVGCRGLLAHIREREGL